MCGQIPQDILDQLMQAKEDARNKYDLTRAIIDAKDRVIGHYSAKFKPKKIGKIGENVLTNFFRLEYNGHWWGLDRHIDKIKEKIHEIRPALETLLDINTDDIYAHIACADKALKGKYVRHSTYTPILHVAHPDIYGVWNGISEKGLQRIGLFPEPWKGQRTWKKYKKFNEQLNCIAKKIDVKLWELDAIWLVVVKSDAELLTLQDTYLRQVKKAANRR